MTDIERFIPVSYTHLDVYKRQGERLEGGRWLKNLDIPLDEMPVYVRQGATIPVYPDEVECTDDMDSVSYTHLDVYKRQTDLFQC